MKNLIWLILAAALFFAYKEWQQRATDSQVAEAPSAEEARPFGGGPVREWEQMPGAINMENRRASSAGTSKSVLRQTKKKLAGQ